MSEQVTDAIIVHCIDFRFQKFLDSWLQQHFGYDHYDRVSLAGGVLDLASVMRQIEISDRLHKIKKVILINHENCGAYGESSTFMRHKEDLEKAENRIENSFSHLEVEIYYLHLDGTFERVSKTKP